jgi:hypothetical protein
LHALFFWMLTVVLASRREFIPVAIDLQQARKAATYALEATQKSAEEIYKQVEER